jgi:hypothetical protein
VRRWLDGRKPSPQYRGELSLLLGVEELDLWPELRAVRKPADLTAVYPRRSLIPYDVWLKAFASAEHEINILAYSAKFLLKDHRFLQVLAGKGERHLRVAVMLGDSSRLDLARVGSDDEGSELLAEHIDEAVEQFRPLAAEGQLELRLHSEILYNSIFRIDGQALVTQHLYGVPASSAPVYHLHKAGQGEMFESYLSSFERIWHGAEVVEV